MSKPPLARPLPAPRIPALDVARAFAVVAMVAGHTLDAVLAPAVRAEPLVALYWMARGFTAPLFMIVAGWAVVAAVSRAGLDGVAVARARFPRVLLLLALGYGLRWPGWGLPRLADGDREVWGHLLAFDALHAIALAIVATSLVLAAGAGPRWKTAVLALLAVAAVSLGVEPLGASVARDGGSSLALLALAQAVGGTSPFPLFPWVGYFFAGALLGTASGNGSGRRAVGIAAAGAVLVLCALSSGTAMAPGDPRLFAYRTGVVLVFLASLSLVPAWVAARVRPVGRASLAVYVIHVPIVYGWSTHQGLSQRIGAELALGSAIAVAAAVLAASFAVRFALLQALGAARAAAGWIAPRLPLAQGARGLIRSA